MCTQIKTRAHVILKFYNKTMFEFERMPYNIVLYNIHTVKGTRERKNFSSMYKVAVAAFVEFIENLNKNSFPSAVRLIRYVQHVF